MLGRHDTTTMTTSTPTPTLIDPFQRRIEYLRVSVTDKCDLRCTYCLPQGFNDFDTPDHWLTFDETERIVRAFASLGVRRIRLTGGEPLVRKNVSELAARIARVDGIDDLSLSTNAVQLARHARDLHAAGVTRLNVSLDSLDAARFQEITGGKLSKVLDGLRAGSDAGFRPIKINMVVMRGVNDDEVERMVEFCIANDFTLRLIETMPVGETGRHAAAHYVDLQQVKLRLERRFDLVPGVMPGGGPARYYRVQGTALRIGFITPISQHFCATCNRVRLAADGTLYLCLGQDDAVDLRTPLRTGIGDEALRRLIVAAIARKPERHEFRERPQHVLRFMAKTGG
jgi:cyclic pyranopterin phosphate synthase